MYFLAKMQLVYYHKSTKTHWKHDIFSNDHWVLIWFSSDLSGAETNDIPWELGQQNDHWCPGSLGCQVINSYDIDYDGQMCP